MSQQPQHLAALAAAQRARLEGAQLKREIARRQTSAASALTDPRAGCLTVTALLMAQPRWGPQTAHKLLASLHIGQLRRVNQLTDRQLRELQAILEDSTSSLAA